MDIEILSDLESEKKTRAVLASFYISDRLVVDTQRLAEFPS
jgi:hypothetical protein